MNKNAFLQALVDNLTHRLYTNVSKTDISQLLEEFDVVDSNKWPSTIESPWPEGEAKVEILCQRYGLTFSECKTAFRDYIDDPSSVPPAILELKAIINTYPVTSADCERGFLAMNNICNDIRNHHTVSHISNLMFISLFGPPVSKFKPHAYVKKWLKSHRSADDTRTRVAVVQKMIDTLNFGKCFNSYHSCLVLLIYSFCVHFYTNLICLQGFKFLCKLYTCV